MAMMNALGGGLLIGTALMVIIPEGVHAIAKHPKADALLGPTLAAGFALMLFCENSGIFVGGHGHSHRGNSTGQTGILMEREIEDMIDSVEDGEDERELRNHATITFGLLIHAAMDGVALGAAIAETHIRKGKGNLGLIVFWGLMLHKGPAAFSLCTFLLNAGVSQEKILFTMCSFALAAPMAAIVTCLSLLWYSGDSVNDNVALALLFSGGTFLYVATCDMLPEIKARAEEIDGRHGKSDKAWLYWMLGGMFLSYLFAIASGHSHGDGDGDGHGAHHAAHP